MVGWVIELARAQKERKRSGLVSLYSVYTARFTQRWSAASINQIRISSHLKSHRVGSHGFALKAGSVAWGG